MHSVYSMPQCTVQRLHRLVTSLLLWELHYGVQLMEHHRGLWWTAQGGGMIARCFRWGYYIVSGTLFCCSNRVLQMTFYLILQKWTFLAVSAPCVSKPLLVCLLIQTTTFCCTAFLSFQQTNQSKTVTKGITLIKGVFVLFVHLVWATYHAWVAWLWALGQGLIGERRAQCASWHRTVYMTEHRQ